MSSVFDQSTFNAEMYNAVHRIARQVLLSSQIPTSSQGDIAQAVCIRFWKKFNAHQIDTSKDVRAYVKRLTKTEAFGAKRKYHRRKSLILYESELSDRSIN